jgi:hypothetical protein
MEDRFFFLDWQIEICSSTPVHCGLLNHRLVMRCLLPHIGDIASLIFLDICANTVATIVRYSRNEAH